MWRIVCSLLYSQLDDCTADLTHFHRTFTVLDFHSVHSIVFSINILIFEHDRRLPFTRLIHKFHLTFFRFFISKVIHANDGGTVSPRWRRHTSHVLVILWRRRHDVSFARVVLCCVRGLVAYFGIFHGGLGG